MNNIFGIYSRDNNSFPPSALNTMQRRTSALGVEGDLWSDDRVGLGIVGKSSASVQHFVSEKIVFVAAGRIDNLRELTRMLHISESDLQKLSDSEIMGRAYLKWGDKVPTKIYGDWACAAWHQNECCLFLARDHHGYTPLYYYVDNQTFAFSSSRRALQALNLVPIQLDELYLAQYLTSWMAYHGERTPHLHIRRLPPAHCLSVNQNTFTVRQYWHLENTPELMLRCSSDYVEAFQDLFDEAVRCRIRTDDKVACSMSGGLDSGSVAVTAARFLRSRGERLTAFTSVPLFDTNGYIKTRFADELPYAQATASHAGNIDLYPMDCAETTPISAIRSTLQINSDLCYGAPNLYWIRNLQLTAQVRGCNVYMTGALGNAGISWDGDIFSQPWLFVLSQLGWQKMSRALYQRMKEKMMRVMPIGLVAAIRHRRMNVQEWQYGSAINPNFAGRIRLIEQILHDPSMLSPRNTIEKRSRYFMPGRSMGGAYAAEIAGANGLEVRDPTADARVLAYTFSVPDRIFIDPQTGLNRWLIREAMKGRLPDKVRLNRNIGVQAGDLVPRLLACAPEVETALSEIAKGPAAEYVDVRYMRQIWQMNQAERTPESRLKAITVLTRGIMAGLLVNQFYE